MRAGVLLAGLILVGTPEVRAGEKAILKALEGTARVYKGQTSGTAFIVSVKDGGKTHSLLVTAAHLFEQIQGKDCTLVLREKSGNTFKRLEVTVPVLDGEKKRWMRHPDVDVAAMEVELPAGANVTPFGYEKIADAKWAEGATTRAGSDVFVPCFPAKLEANESGWPVLRRGTIASHPLTPLTQAKTMLVDYTHFGGDSGAPVVVCDGDEPLVVGLVIAMQRQTDRTTSPFEERTVHTPLGLAIAVQAPLIRETVEALLRQEK